MEVKTGYQKFENNEPLILEPEDWTPDEWATLCKLAGQLPPDRTQRVVISRYTLESYVEAAPMVGIPADISAVALNLLTPCMDDYDTRVWERIKQDVIEDVMECSGIQDGEGFTDGDVALAIGRAVLKALGGEV